MRLAIVSLPVPVSPTISTLLSLSAITRTKSKTVRIRGLCPTTIESKENAWKVEHVDRPHPQPRCQRRIAGISGHFPRQRRKPGTARPDRRISGSRRASATGTPVATARFRWESARRPDGHGPCDTGRA